MSISKTIRYSVVAILLMAFATPMPAQAKYNPKYGSIVIDAETGRVLRARNADKRLHPASLTKMMTLFLTFEALDDGRLTMNQSLRFSHRAAAQEPSKIGTKAGGRIKVKDAILSLVTKSANDVAVVLAEAIGGSEAQFAAMMTQRARALGMNNTTFKNASGLHHPSQVSTPRDMATLSRALMQYFPHRYHLFSTNTFAYQGKSYKNHNKLLTSYRGMDGLKTGYVRASGFNLAASAVRDNRRLIGVVFGGRSSKTRNAHMAQILDESFQRLPRKSTIMVHNDAPPVPGRKPTPPVTIAEIDTANYNNQIIGEGDMDAEATQRLQVALASASAVTGVERDLASINQTGDQNWGIQVGAFKSRAAGDKALRDTRKSLSVIPRYARSIITPLQTNDGLFFRARIMGLNAQSAEQACKLLADCLVISAR